MSLVHLNLLLLSSQRCTRIYPQQPHSLDHVLDCVERCGFVSTSMNLDGKLAPCMEAPILVQVCMSSISAFKALRVSGVKITVSLYCTITNLEHAWSVCCCSSKCSVVLHQPGTQPPLLLTVLLWLLSVSEQLQTCLEMHCSLGVTCNSFSYGYACSASWC